MTTPEKYRFGNYQVHTRWDGAPVELGRGAMGVTFKAFDAVLGHDVALKVLKVRAADPPQAQQERRDRFLREARAAAQLQHPNVAAVYHYGVREADGQCFYAMELVKGETLEARLRREGPLPAAEALELVAQVARALEAAKALHLVHRDLKPANLMLTPRPDPTVKVIDFGMAQAAAARERDGFSGTVEYASPEQLSGASVDGRSDLYALGVTLWQLLSGELPFRGSSAEVKQQHLHARLPLEQLPGVPQPAVALLEKLLQKEPDDRFQNATELLEAIREALDAIQGGRTLSWLLKPKRWRFRMPRTSAGSRTRPLRRALAWASLVVVLLGVALTAFRECSRPPPAPFALEVQVVHEEGGRQGLTGRDLGWVRLERGTEGYAEPIREDGTAHFAALPAAFRTRPVSIRLVDSADFELSSPNEQRLPEGGRLELAVRKKPGRIAGRVQDEDGNALAGAKVSVAGLSALTDSAGHFEFVIPGERLKLALELGVVKAGYLAKHFRVVPNANEVVVQLRRAP
jgi:tRNA A-37 threonylcarbamoyl transferase component Bud32